MKTWTLYSSLRSGGRVKRAGGRPYRSRQALAVMLSALTGFLLPHFARAQNVYLQHNLVSDLPGLADHTDTNLVNPWGIAFSPTGPFWISDNHSGLSTLAAAGFPITQPQTNADLSAVH